MGPVNILAAKTNLSKLVEAVESGKEKEIVLSRNGKPVVKIVPLPVVDKSKRIGGAKGKFPDIDFETFQAMDKEIERMFNGENEA